VKGAGALFVPSTSCGYGTSCGYCNSSDFGNAEAGEYFMHDRLSHNGFMFPIFVVASILLLSTTAFGQEKRAKPPKFDSASFPGVFYDDLSAAVSSGRPRIDQLNSATGADVTTPSGQMTGEAGTGTASDSAGGSKGKWRSLVEPLQLEDEVKKMKLHYDSLVTTPGRFKSGDFKIARVDLAILATLMAVIHEYEGEVRFKKDAAIARDALASAAVTVAGGADNIFDVAMQRRNDLQDLVSGSGLNRTAPATPTDWSVVSTRSPLMEYLQQQMDETLLSGTADDASVAEALEEIKRSGAIVAVIAEVLNQEGMEGADDEDYRKLSDAMKSAALDLRGALERNDAAGARISVGEISKSCSTCHDVYR
jgi:hypothetical protein